MPLSDNGVLEKHNSLLVCAAESLSKLCLPSQITFASMNSEVNSTNYVILSEITCRNNKSLVSCQDFILSSTPLMELIAKNLQMLPCSSIRFSSTNSTRRTLAILYYFWTNKTKRDFMGTKSWWRELKMKLRQLSYLEGIKSKMLKGKRTTWRPSRRDSI